MKTDTAPVAEQNTEKQEESAPASRLNIEIPLDEVKGGTCTSRCNTCTSACICKRTALEM